MKFWRTVVLTITALAIIALGTSPAFAADGAALYKGKCAACHGADGSKTKMGANTMRPLNGADVQKQSDQELIDLTSKGKGKMPAYEAKMSADEIKAVVAHIRTLKK